MVVEPKPWQTLGISRATWYRYGKPTDKAVYDDMRWDKQGSHGTLAEAFAEAKAEKPRSPYNLNNLADGLMAESRENRPLSVRTYQRLMRVRKSELWPWVKAGELSYAKADWWLSNPRQMQRFRKWLAEQKTKAKETDGS